MYSNLDRQNVAKKLIKGRGKDVIEQRNERRHRLINQFKSLRVKLVDDFRNLNENEITLKVLSDIKKQILSTLDQKNLIREDEIDYFLEDLDTELKAMEAEQYDKLYEDEIEATITNLMNKCAVCDNLITESEICEFCVQKHFSNQF